jgi:hypothetical protein
MRILLTILCIASLSLSAYAQNKETRSVGDFDEIIMRVGGKVLITQGTKNEVVLEGREDLLEDIETEVRGGRLNIKHRNSRWKNSRNDRLTVYITVKKLRGAYISGSGDIISQNTLKSDDFTASISGSGDIELDIEANDTEARISGSGNIELSGKADKVKLVISGSGKFLAEKLVAGDYDVNLSGSGRGSINVNGELDVRISGSGRIYYLGDPTHVNRRVSGSGRIRRIN